jgi:hypothetical protein
MLTITIEKNMIFTVFFNSHKLTFVLYLSSTLVCLGFFQLSFTCPFHLKIGTCLNIMLKNNFNLHTPWYSRNPYNLRLNKKQALSGSLEKNEISNFQRYNTLSAYEVKDETSTNSTYVSLAFYPLKFFDDFKLKTASKHPFLNQAIHFIFLNSFLESNCRIF